MKRIKILSGLAIGLSLICVSKWIHQHTQEQFLKRIHYKPIQFNIDKQKSRISKDFYLEFDAIYELKLKSDLHRESEPKILIPPTKIEIITNNRKVHIFKYDESNCNNNANYDVCSLASFRGSPEQKYSISMEISGVDSRLYAFNPEIEASISTMSLTKGYKLGEDLKEAFFFATGFLILSISILILVIEFFKNRYKHNQ